MAVSDTLSDSAEDIREYLEQYPDYYEFIRPDLDRLLKEMDRLRIKLDEPPANRTPGKT